MAIFTREQLEQQVAAEQGNGIDTSQDRSHIETYSPPPAPRDVRRAIYNAVYSQGRANRADIAKALNVRKTPWLRDHIERLVTEGYLVKIEGVEKNGALKFLYEV
ncbi:MAG TPA: winged helix-turn-helix domain-containing protein, partial [Phototrophicaceae bacterium]|nr:winged helix-turn-helix domain-containing protein [Phototrophicaceae bacterium]